MDAASASVNVTALGAHVLKARATDSAGHVSAEGSWVFSVKTTPTLTRTPNVSTLIKRRYQTQTFKVTVRRSSGARIAGKYVYLERSTNGRTWTRYASIKTNGSGEAWKTIRFSTRGYTWWRWTSPKDASYNLVTTKYTRVTVR